MDGPAVEIDDPAARAFEGVRAEVALLRRAVEGLAAERAGIEMPDYAPTLAQIAQAVRTTATRLDRMSESPALAIGPEEMAGRITTAGDIARREDHNALAAARAALDQATRQIGFYMDSARKGHIQDGWLAITGVSGLALGMALWATFAGPIDRAMPQSWHWPEKRAARAVGLPMWQAGLRLMGTADPAAVRALLAENNIVQTNRDPIERCTKAATRQQEPVDCTVSIGPLK